MQIKYQDIELTVIPDAHHEWLLETALVAEGYDISPANIRKAKSRNEVEFVEGKHYVVQNVTVKNSLKTKIFWTKRGVVTLGFFLNSDRARQFRRWAEDLILRVIARPVESLENLSEHTKRDVQISNSKSVNSYVINNWDRETLIEYNQKNCKLVSGYSPSELRTIGKRAGLKSKQYSSGKEVLRNLKPSLAAQMSINDDLVQRGVKLNQANTLSAPCVPLLEKMIELKMLNP